MQVLVDNCLGCGACISSCPTKSLSLIPVTRPEIPEKKKDLFKQILKEKKRLTPFVISGIKKKIRRKKIFSFNNNASFSINRLTDFIIIFEYEDSS